MSTDSATAIECVHAFSLVHDDLPVMDNDRLGVERIHCTSNMMKPLRYL